MFSIRVVSPVFNAYSFGQRQASIKSREHKLKAQGLRLFTSATEKDYPSNLSNKNDTRVLVRSCQYLHMRNQTSSKLAFSLYKLLMV